MLIRDGCWSGVESASQICSGRRGQSIAEVKKNGYFSKEKRR
jgi:hypothetical protein